jgi:O-6-methylguanine DNA methyltransferase
MRMAATDAGICLFEFEHRKSINTILDRVGNALNDRFQEGDHPYFIALEQQVNEYFQGVRQEFDLPLDLLGTPFQVKVWRGLLDIPYGQTRSYEQQSRFLGDEKAIRAVAGANGQNGIAIIIPCHRVIGKDGSLTGYGGGIQRKKWLLEHERLHSGKQVQATLF